MIVHDITTRVLREFGDEASVEINEDDVIRWVNDGLKYIIVSNDLLQTTGTINSVANQSEYPFPADMLSMHAMFYNNLRVKFMKFSEFNEYIKTTDPNQNSAGTPWMYTRWSTNFTLYPKPDTAIAAGIKLYYLKRPAELTVPEDPVPLPVEYHPELVKYCLQRAYQTDEDWDAAQIMRDQFVDGIDRLKEQETFQDRESYPSITVLTDDL